MTAPIVFFRPTTLGLFLFFCAGFADGLMVPFFPLWASEAGVPTYAIGLLFGCYAGGELLAAPLLGGVADRIGRRPVLIVSSFGVGIGFTALFFAHGVAPTAILLALTGVCESVLHPTVLTVIGDTTAQSEHRRWYGFARMSSSAGQVAGPVSGALLSHVSLSAVFLAAGGMLIFGGAAVAIFLSETGAIREQPQGPGDADEHFATLLPALKDGRLARLLLWFMMFEICGNWIESVIPLYARDTGLLSPSGVGLLFTYAAALTVGLQMLVTRFADARSGLFLTICAGGGCIAGFGLLLATPSVVSLLGAVSLCAVAQMLTGPIIPAAVQALSPDSRRAAYMSAASVVVDLKDSLGPSAGTFLYSVAPRLPWSVGIPLVAAASLGLGLALGATVRRTDPASRDQ